MKRKSMMAAPMLAVLLIGGTAHAGTVEDKCRKIQLDLFDELTMRTCPDNKRRGVSTAGPCSELLLALDRFVPTAKMPDWATYRMMWSEIRTEVCVHFP